jgi:hypothetical protein
MRKVVRPSKVIEIRVVCRCQSLVWTSFTMRDAAIGNKKINKKKVCSLSRAETCEVVHKYKKKNK